MLRKNPIALALCLAWALNPTAAAAQQAPDSKSTITRLNEITVSATRTEPHVDKVPNTVTVAAAETIEQAGSAQFSPSSYAVLDLDLFWKPIRNLSLNANLNNLFDQKYWRWSDVRGPTDNSPVKDACSAAGRNAQVSIRYDF